MRSESSRSIANEHRISRPFGSRPSVIALMGTFLIAAAWLSPLRPAVVVGTSMSPTLEPGQVVWCDRASKPTSLHRGDVVLATVNGEVCVKRVFAVGGDRFWKTWGMATDDSLPQLVDVGTPIAPWKERYPFFKFQQVRIPAGMVYLLGDGVNSIDSRKFGPVEEKSLIGRVVYPPAPRNLEECEPSVWSALPTRPMRLSRS